MIRASRILVTIDRAELVAALACSDGLAAFDELSAMQGQIAGRWSFELTPLFNAMFATSAYGRHRAWLVESGFLPPAYLSGADLSGADLSGADLSGAERPMWLPEQWMVTREGFIARRES